MRRVRFDKLLLAASPHQQPPQVSDVHGDGLLEQPEVQRDPSESERHAVEFNESSQLRPLDQHADETVNRPVEVSFGVLRVCRTASVGVRCRQLLGIEEKSQTAMTRCSFCSSDEALSPGGRSGCRGDVDGMPSFSGHARSRSHDSPTRSMCRRRQPARGRQTR